jgi:hypothetical protein
VKLGMARGGKNEASDRQDLAVGPVISALHMAGSGIGNRRRTSRRGNTKEWDSPPDSQTIRGIYESPAIYNS